MTAIEIRVQLKLKAIDAIIAFNEKYARQPKGYVSYGEPTSYAVEIAKAAAESCAWTEAYAIATQKGYDAAAAELHELAKKKQEVGTF